jgi:anti-anti-sigma regulatory factor
MSEYKTFQVRDHGPVALIQPTDSEILHRDLINRLSDELIEYIDQARPERVLITLKQVTRYSSEAIGGLIRVRKHIKKYGGDMKLCMNGESRELFKVTRLDGTLFEIFETESEGIASFFPHGGEPAGS